MEDKIFAFWLCNLPGIGNRKIEYMIQYFGSPKEIFFGADRHFGQIEGLSEKDVWKITKNRNIDQLKKRYEIATERGIHFVCQEETAYPEKLRQLENMPYGLFYKGRLPLENVPSVAIVGARDSSYEAKQLAGKFGYELAENGIQVISGMARGVDIAAQNGAMRSDRGRTYGILGTGVDICYPRQHIESYMMMQEQGGVISQFPLQTPALPYNFPMRNGVISALADGILVIEAGKGSGSLITAELGLEQGKEIFVLPGNITNPRYEGGNELLKNGAVLVTSVLDILDGLGLFFDQDVVERKKKSKDMLETAEKMVYASLGLEPIHISEIVEKTGLELADTMEILLSLQMKQLVQTVGNNYFAMKL